MSHQDTINLSQILKHYEDTWVALSKDFNRVVSSGETPKEVVEKAKQKGHANPHVFWASSNYGGYVSGCACEKSTSTSSCHRP